MKSFMNMSFRLLIVLFIILGLIACRDDKNGAIYKITIEQSGTFEPFKKQLILIASGGLYDEINKENIDKPILESSYFSTEKISLITREKIDVFVATLSINPKKSVITDNYILKVAVFKNDKMVYKEKAIYTPDTKYPQTIHISK